MGSDYNSAVTDAYERKQKPALKDGDAALLQVEIVRVGNKLALIRLPMSESMSRPTVVEAIVPLEVLIPATRIPSHMVALREANAKIECQREIVVDNNSSPK